MARISDCRHNFWHWPLRMAPWDPVRFRLSGAGMPQKSLGRRHHSPCHYQFPSSPLGYFSQGLLFLVTSAAATVQYLNLWLLLIRVSHKRKAARTDKTHTETSHSVALAVADWPFSWSPILVKFATVLHRSYKSMQDSCAYQYLWLFLYGDIRISPLFSICVFIPRRIIQGMNVGLFYTVLQFALFLSMGFTSAVN